MPTSPVALRAGERVEQRRLAGARQPDDPDLEGQASAPGFRRICFCSDTSARCCSDLIAPSVLSRIVATSAFGKLNTNFSVSTCCCSVREVLDQLEHALPADRPASPRPRRRARSRPRARAPLPPAASGGCARKWSIARLCAMRNSQAENGADCHLKRPDRLEHLQERLRRQILRVVPVADAHVEVAVDAVEVEQVQLFERLAGRPAGRGRRASARGRWSRSRAVRRPGWLLQPFTWGDAPVAPPSTLRSRAEPDATFPGETLHVDDAPQRDRCSGRPRRRATAQPRPSRRGAPPSRGLLERVGTRRCDERAHDLPAVERDLDPDPLGSAN